MKFDKILIPLDGSRFAEAALPKAVELVRDNPDATLILLRTAEATAFPGVDRIDDAQVLVVDEVEDYLEAVAERLREDGVPEVRPSVWYGPAAPAILEAARLTNPDHAWPDSINLGWRNASFRGYADYMQTEDFAARLERLDQLATRRPTVIMCAEALPWRCHRSLIADALTVARWRVLHIQSRKTARPHKRTPSLRVRSGRLVYPRASRYLAA